MPILAAILFALAVSLPWAPKALATNHLDIQITLNPQNKDLQAKVQLQLPSPQHTIVFRLHRNLTLSQNSKFKLQTVSEEGIATVYKISALTPTQEFEFNYNGSINEPIENNDSPGIISEVGVTLMGDSYWLPTLESTFTYKIEITTPQDWEALTSGRIAAERKGYKLFISEFAISHLTLVANRFYVFKSEADPRLEVWLLKDEANLAHSYLQKGAEYMAHYSQFLGDYPFARYTIVENFIETGFAMPSFTLLGSSVIRLPFIITSSLPHEILHSWWGNSIEVDYQSGNWCEGLTTHMADHWVQNSNQNGSKYRRKSLQGYQDFVRSETDFPIRKFVAKNDAGTQAVGYGKSMMFFNMLELYLGEDLFRKGLVDFYQKHKFQVASFVDIQNSMEKITGLHLQSFFNPWLDQTGAPTLKLNHATVTSSQDQHHLSFNVGLDYNGILPVFPLQYVVHLSDGQKITKTAVLSESSTQILESFPSRPLRLELDPSYMSFRTLYPQETPPAFSRVLGTRGKIYVSYPHAEASLWQGWLQSLPKILPTTPIIITDQQALPADGALWALGSQNAHLAMLEKALTGRGLTRIQNSWRYQQTNFDLKTDAIFTVESLGNLNVLAVITQPEASHEILLSKIPHYSSFSIAAFRNNKNFLREEYQTIQSPLSKDF